MRRGAASGEHGTSLVELVVTLGVASTLLLALGTTFAGTLRSTGGVTSRTSAAADARLALETLGRRLRVAVRPPGASSMLLSATSTSVTFYASIAAPDATGVAGAVLPTLVEYEIDPTSRCLREAQTRAVATTVDGTVTLSWPVAGRTSRCLVLGDVDALGAGVFSYYSTADGSTPVASAALASSLNTVRSVAITVAVRAAASAASGPTRMQTRVDLANRLFEDASGKSS